jgi:hypothetical protein
MTRSPLLQGWVELILFGQSLAARSFDAKPS